jgi:hypothetical protein
MRIEEIKIGQTIRHTKGFEGIVREVKGTNMYADVVVEITDSGGYRGLWSEGEIYTGMAEFMTLVKDVPTKSVIEIDVVTNFEDELEKANDLYETLVDIEDQMMDIRLEAEAVASLKNEESVFECDIQGMTFKGTKSDFAVFIDGVTKMGKALQNQF